MNNIADMNNLVQDVIDGYENPKRAVKLITRRRDDIIDELQMLTRCLEEIEGADIEESQVIVLKKRFDNYLGTGLESFLELSEVIQTTKVTDLSCRLEDQVQIILGAIAEIKKDLG